MKIKIIIFSLFLTTLSSCFILEAAFGSCASPSKKEYKYYNPNFVLDSLSGIQTNNKIYIMKIERRNKLTAHYVPASLDDYYNMFIFFDKGIVKNDKLHEGQKIPKRFLRSRLTGRSGYYITKNDSIVFTTDPCTNHEFESVFKGILKGDTLILKGDFIGYGYSESNREDEYILLAKSISEVRAILSKED